MNGEANAAGRSPFPIEGSPASPHHNNDGATFPSLFTWWRVTNGGDGDLAVRTLWILRTEGQGRDGMYDAYTRKQNAKANKKEEMHKFRQRKSARKGVNRRDIVLQSYGVGTASLVRHR
jgi:hypothetical protein